MIERALRMQYTGAVFRDVKQSRWSEEHIAKHGVTLDEVREAIIERPYWRQPGRDGTVEIFGQTYSGRCLFVVVVDEGENAFVVTAREMDEAQKKTFRRKAR